jgi:hypothetical protein
MSIVQTATTNFKIGLLDGTFNFDTGTTQTFKIALYTANANLNASTTAYTTSGEVVGTGYTAGGKTLTVSQVPTSTGTVAYLSFSDVSWTNSTLTARAALIYKYDGATNPAIAVLDFGSDKITVGGTFQIVFPAATSTSAIIRIS